MVEVVNKPIAVRAVGKRGVVVELLELAKGLALKWFVDGADGFATMQLQNI